MCYGGFNRLGFQAPSLGSHIVLTQTLSPATHRALTVRLVPREKVVTPDPRETLVLLDLLDLLAKPDLR